MCDIEVIENVALYTHKNVFSLTKFERKKLKILLKNWDIDIRFKTTILHRYLWRFSEKKKTKNHDRDFHRGIQKRRHPYKYRSVTVMENGMTIIELKRSRNRRDTKSAHGIDVFIAFIYIAGHVKDNGKVKKTFWTKVGVADRRKQYQTIGPAVLRNLRHSAATHFLTIQNYPVGFGTKTSNRHI